MPDEKRQEWVRNLTINAKALINKLKGMKAVWNQQIIAESQNTVEIEGNHYFPPDSVHMQYLQDSNTLTICAWKGTAGYFHIEVNGERNEDAAWIYRNPSQDAKLIKDHIAFWKGVEVIND